MDLKPDAALELLAIKLFESHRQPGIRIGSPAPWLEQELDVRQAFRQLARKLMGEQTT